MNVAFLLHLYQPATQEEKTFREIAHSSYIPLLKFLKTHKNVNISLNVPLSLLSQMDAYGYDSWISDLKDLVHNDRVELVGSAAYHPILTKLPREFAERQVILNEYGMGYYFGRHTGFEGEEAIMIKDLKGFFPPELAVNDDLVKMLNDLGYEWVLVDATAIPESVNDSHKYGVFSLDNYNTKVVCRNRLFSNMLSFKRDLNMVEVIDSLNFFKANNRSFCAVLDGEFFGHHFDKGIDFLELLAESMSEIGINIITISDYVRGDSVQRMSSISESSWGASDEDMKKGEFYPMWCNSKNAIHKLQWELLHELLDVYTASEYFDVKNPDDYQILPVWLPKKMDDIKDKTLRKTLEVELAVNKALASDQFWWASGIGLPTGQILYSGDMIIRSLNMYKEVSKVLENRPFDRFVDESIENLKKLIS
ncbi:MAG: hypothetical protein WC243_03415 [Patescibacteria group bacterium]|jgi:predicted glycosyl hydrolase (DUF1957 family)